MPLSRVRVTGLLGELLFSAVCEENRVRALYICEGFEGFTEGRNKAVLRLVFWLSIGLICIYTLAFEDCSIKNNL